MRFFSIIFTLFSVFFLVVIFAGNWLCSSPAHYEITGNKMQLVEIKNIQRHYDTTETFRKQVKEIKIDSFYYYQIQKTDTLKQNGNYGLLITNDINYCINSSGNVANAVPMPGILGSQQVMQSTRLFLLDNHSQVIKEISEFLLPSDSISDYRTNDMAWQQSCEGILTTSSVNSLKDSFNLKWSKGPLGALNRELFYLFPQNIITEFPNHFILKLEIKFTDGTVQESFLDGSKK